MVGAVLEEGILARGIERGMLDVQVHNLRIYTPDRHRTVDDEPFGGGPGMVMKPEPFVEAVEAITRARGSSGAVVLPTPQGAVFRQEDAERLRRAGHVVLLCGRYEGIDDRVRQLVAAEELSVGDYVVSGGELPALIMVDAISRLVPGVVGDEQSVVEESFADGLLDFPHFTRPATFRGEVVPDVLRSGNHGQVKRWRRKAALERTLQWRPDLLEQAVLNEEARELLGEIRAERAQRERVAIRVGEDVRRRVSTASEDDDERD